MKVINRKMTIEVIKNHDNREIAKTQAAFNSDDCITVRSFYDGNKDDDTILILSKRETDAIIKLFQKLKNRDILPF